MSAPDRDTIAKVRLWISYAEDDLSVAVHIMELREHVPYRLAAYHAQQCVEKYLKAYLGSPRVRARAG